MEVSNQHLLDTTVLKVVLDGIERAEDDTLHSVKVGLQGEHIKQSVDGVQRLFHLFYKYNQVLSGREMEPCAHDGANAGEVAADEDALGMTDHLGSCIAAGCRTGCYG